MELTTLAEIIDDTKERVPRIYENLSLPKRYHSSEYLSRKQQDGEAICDVPVPQLPVRHSLDNLASNQRDEAMSNDVAAACHKRETFPITDSTNRGDERAVDNKVSRVFGSGVWSRTIRRKRFAGRVEGSSQAFDDRALNTCGRSKKTRCFLIILLLVVIFGGLSVYIGMNLKHWIYKSTETDVDECMSKSHICSANATCTNTDGGYNCSCNQGYEGDGFECVDVNECMRKSHNCSANAICTNTDGGYSCSCSQGYEGDGFECIDVDECMAKSHNCSANAICTNTDGGYNCSCNQGYEGDRLECVDVDECMTKSHNCTADATCTNTDGGYNCSCIQGYEGDGFECVDVDECMTKSHNCSTNATCTNTDGGYNCSCNQEYEGDGFECVDIDECQNGGNTCDENAECTNTEGSYTCACDTGYYGNGVICYVNCARDSQGLLQGYCFAHDLRKTYAEARADCLDMGAELASIHSQSKQDFIGQHTIDLGSLSGHGAWWGYWIGLNDMTTEGEFGWTDGTQIDFLNWESSQPNNLRENQDCVAVAPSLDDEWIDRLCDAMYPYICEKT